MENKNKVRIAYDKKNDGFNLMLSTDGGEEWEFQLGCKCRRSDSCQLDDEPMFVSIELIEELKRAVLCGFEFVY